MEEFDYVKLKYILTPPTGTKFLRMTRPIEKVSRNNGCQIGALLFNLFVVGLFVFAGVEDWLTNTKNVEQLVGFSLSAFFFIITIVFYALTMINPGYVET